MLDVIDYMHEVLASKLKEGDKAVDATLGNGHDALHLCKLVGGTGEVWGFDVQKAAIESSKKLLESEGVKTTLHLMEESHAKIATIVPKGIKACVFNLGWLPGGDKSVVTSSQSTIEALKGALDILDYDGVITIVAYPGHAGGDTERDAVAQFLSQLPQKEYDILSYRFLNRPDRAPVGMVAHRKPLK